MVPYELADSWLVVARREKERLREFVGGETVKVVAPPQIDDAIEIMESRFPASAGIPRSWWYTGRTESGQKLGRYLRELIPENDRAIFDELWNRLAPLLRSHDIIVTVSPGEYPNISDNTTGWRSCHSPGGAYFWGNFAYMFDKHTVVAYAPDSSGRKKWRMLIYLAFDPPCMIFSREYPQHIQNAYETVRSFLIERYCEFWGDLPYRQNSDRVWVDDGGGELFSPYIDRASFEVFSHRELPYNTTLNLKDAIMLAREYLLFECRFCGQFWPIDWYDWENKSCLGSILCESCRDILPSCQIVEADGKFLCLQCYNEYMEQLEK